MNDEQEQVNRIAERIARRLNQTNGVAKSGGQTNDQTPDVAALRASLAEMQKQLAQLESQITQNPSNGNSRNIAARQNETSAANTAASSYHAPQTVSTTYISAVQASEERFNINEAVSELVDFFEQEKICELEPGGKKCDHCAMCSARGF